MRLIDADELLRKLEEYFNEKEQDAKFTGSRGSEVQWNDAIYYIKTAPTAQSEQDAEFWRKRAEEYRDQCIALTADMVKGVKFDSMCFNEDGLVFKRGQPEQRWIPVDLRNNSPEENKGVLLGVRFRDDFKYFVTSRQDYNYWTGLGREIKGELRWQELPKPYRKEGEF